ncbi:hypothetical protein ACFO0N_02375 [Halobium salinum]|uniref:DUF2157 domain-containing protein n=1 Tax=Halobium salinum TaxID=1364940 RepID=A0ABD5P7F8_9EURY|nr:hypothetical protein [Halobium salinum]
MAQYGRMRAVEASEWRRMRASAVAGLVGGALLTAVAALIHVVVTDAQFAVINWVGAVAMLLVVAGLPALYLAERHWFGTLARVAFGTLAVGWVVTAASLALLAAGVDLAGLTFLVGWLVAMLGAFALGVLMLRSDGLTVPRLGAWLFVAALPVGLPASVAFTTYVLGQGDTPWNGPLVLFGLAWVVVCRALWSRRAGRAASGTVPQ